MLKEHTFSIDNALRYGLHEAIVLGCLTRLLNTQQDDADYFEESGVGWLKLTLRQLQGELPYLSTFKIKSALDALDEYGLVKIKDINADCAVGKRKCLCYSLTERGLKF